MMRTLKNRRMESTSGQSKVRTTITDVLWLGTVIAIAHSTLIAFQKLEHYKECWIARDIPLIGKRLCDKYNNGKFLCEVT